MNELNRNEDFSINGYSPGFESPLVERREKLSQLLTKRPLKESLTTFDLMSRFFLVFNPAFAVISAARAGLCLGLGETGDAAISSIATAYALGTTYWWIYQARK